MMMEQHAFGSIQMSLYLPRARDRSQLMRMANKGRINAGSLRQCQRFVQTLSRQWSCRQGAEPWWLRCRLESTTLMKSGASQEQTVNTIVTECAPLQHHAASHSCSQNHHQNSDAARPRAMSTNTKSGSVVSIRVPDKKDSSAHAHGDKWRNNFLEKQADQRKKFDNVKALPSIKGEDWWTPDPMTGVYVPEYYHGCVTTAPRESRKRSSGPGASYMRSETDLDQDQAPWFDNMEELPDMDRHKKK